MIRLSLYKSKLNRGRSKIVEAIWIVIEAIVLNSILPSSRIKVFALRLFGAEIGSSVVIRKYVRVKFPWRLQIGNNVWIGESVWIDNLENVRIEDNCCISQGVYICTGNHNFKAATFDLISEGITIQESSWLGAFSIIGPGVVIHSGTKIKMGERVFRHIATPANQH